jgi:hypothetical protein
METVLLLLLIAVPTDTAMNSGNISRAESGTISGIQTSMDTMWDTEQQNKLMHPEKLIPDAGA